jgi:hypothetical protein
MPLFEFLIEGIYVPWLLPIPMLPDWLIKAWCSNMLSMAYLEQEDSLGLFKRAGHL